MERQVREALIWGASGGMGSAVVDALHKRDWVVHTASRSDQSPSANGGVALSFDTEREDSVRTACFEVAQISSGLDLMVYAVGDMVYNRLDEMGTSDWNRVLLSNLTGAFWVANYAIPLMNPGAQLVFIGAYIDHLRLPRMGAYAVAKAGLQELVAVLAKENRKLKFTILRPGPVNTSFWNKVGFRMPADAKSPAQVAEALMIHVEAGSDGSLDL